MSTRGHKQDGGKNRWSILPWSALDQVAKVLTWAADAKGYPGRGYMDLENGAERYMDAACRHISEHMQGRRTDAESGLPVLAHAATDLLIVLAIELENGSTK